jgi:hypothetical protein
MAYDNNMSGAIFRNKRKEKDAHPDRTGQCTIDGKEYWISGWMKEKDGEPYMSIAFQPKKGRDDQRKSESKPTGGKIGDMEDDIPW